MIDNEATTTQDRSESSAKYKVGDEVLYVRGAAQSVRQSSAAKGMAGLIKSLRTN